MTTLNPTRTRSLRTPINLLLAGVAALAIGASAVSLRSNEQQSERPGSAWALASSGPAAALSPAEQFASEMALHEALTDAVFGSMSGRPDLQAEIAAATAEHEAHIEPFMISHGSQVAPPRDDSAEIAAAIAEHEALIEPFVS